MRGDLAVYTVHVADIPTTALLSRTAPTTWTLREHAGPRNAEPPRQSQHALTHWLADSQPR
jgi:hypothetical protein